MKAVKFKRVTTDAALFNYNYHVFRDDQYVGTLIGVFDKPSDRYRSMIAMEYDDYRHAERRGWVPCGLLDDTLGIDEAELRYISWPLREVQALLRHVLGNDLDILGMSAEELIAFAKHCRAMELAKRRGK